MNVDEVGTLYQLMRTISKHFECSIKSINNGNPRVITITYHLLVPDKDGILVAEVFAAPNSIATKVESMEKPSADEFCILYGLIKW